MWYLLVSLLCRVLANRSYKLHPQPETVVVLRLNNKSDLNPNLPIYPLSDLYDFASSAYFSVQLTKLNNNPMLGIEADYEGLLPYQNLQTDNFAGISPSGSSF